MFDKVIELFAGKFSHAVVQENLQQNTEQLKRLTDDEILSQTDDALIEDALALATFKVPVIRSDDIYMEEMEVERTFESRGYDVYSDRSGGSRQTVKQHLVAFHVPFDGNREYFHIQPSSRLIRGSMAVLGAGEIVIPLATANKTGDQLKAALDSQLTSIKQDLATLERDLAAARPQMGNIARSYIPGRRAEILRNKNLAASLGFPMKRRPEAPTTYKAPEVKRKIVPARAATPAAFKPEPALDEAEYQHILSVMDNMTRVMERSPHVFASMEEEDIRQHFLVQLNSQYEGQATGETFNAQGKTDILIRSDGRNIFIAECKFWRGEKSFSDAVDQLLGYLTWRDTKTALVIFNKNKNLTGVIDKIREIMNAHPHKKRGPNDQGETRFQYIFGNPGDPSREITITVMVYDIPQAA